MFFFNDTATTEIYTLSLHDALPIYSPVLLILDDLHWSGRPTLGLLKHVQLAAPSAMPLLVMATHRPTIVAPRSEEHTSELQSRQYLVCRLLLEKNTT